MPKRTEGPQAAKHRDIDIAPHRGVLIDHDPLAGERAWLLGSAEDAEIPLDIRAHRRGLHRLHQGLRLFEHALLVEERAVSTLGVFLRAGLCHMLQDGRLIVFEHLARLLVELDAVPVRRDMAAGDHEARHLGFDDGTGRRITDLQGCVVGQRRGRDVAIVRHLAAGVPDGGGDGFGDARGAREPCVRVCDAQIARDRDRLAPLDVACRDEVLDIAARADVDLQIRHELHVVPQRARAECQRLGRSAEPVRMHGHRVPVTHNRHVREAQRRDPARRGEDQTIGAVQRDVLPMAGFLDRLEQPIGILRPILRQHECCAVFAVHDDQVRNILRVDALIRFGHQDVAARIDRRSLALGRGEERGQGFRTSQRPHGHRIAPLHDL